MRKRPTRTLAIALLAGSALAGSAVAQASTGTTEPGGDAATEATTAETTAATDAAPTETQPPPTAPARGDADLVIWADDTRTPIMREIAEPFAAELGIVVDVQEVAGPDIRPLLTVTGPQGEGPDVIVTAHDGIGEAVADGVVEPLDLSGVADGFEGVAIDAFTYEGQTYGVPYAVENIALFRNTDLVPEAPATFEEMMQIAADFKAEHADDPTYLGLAVQVAPEGDTYHYQPFLSAFGGYIFAQNEDGTFNPDDLGLDSEGGLAAATWLQEQGAAGLLSADVTYDVMKESFGAGRAPFAVTGPWVITDQNNGFEMAGVPFAISAIPAREGGEAPAVFVGVQGFMVSSFSEQKDLATSFVVDYLSQEASQLALFEAGGRPPALTAAYEQVADDPEIAGFGESAANGIPLPAIPQMSAVWDSTNLAQLNTLRGADGPEEFTAAAEQIRSQISG